MKKYLLAAALPLVAAITFSASADEAQHCFQAQGQVTLTPTDPSTCNSPIGVCAVGELRGTLRAGSAFTGTSFAPTVDTSTTGVVLLTGDNAIHTSGGVLYTKDAIVLQTIGEGEFAELDVIVGGTGDFAGATGVLTAHGTYNAVTGGSGTYFGRICVE